MLNKNLVNKQTLFIMSQMGSIRRLIFSSFVKLCLFFRYRIKLKGVEDLEREKFNPKKGILFLANHPALVDPLILTKSLWPTFRFHPVAVDFLFQEPIMRPFLEAVEALAVPNFEDFTNSYKIKQIEKAIEQIISLLNSGKNVLIYPGGGLKTEGYEVVGGNSGIQTILSRCPDVNLVLIRTVGLWGSSYSTALTGESPHFSKRTLENFKIVLKNFLFFTPKREVTIECEVPRDFPVHGTRLQINQYLEKWYNREGPELLKLVPYYFWKKQLPQVAPRKEKEKIDFSLIPEEIKGKVIEEIAHLAKMDAAQVKLEHHLATDLGLDSLDQAQLVVFLKEVFGINAVPSSDLVSVGDCVALAAKVKKEKERKEEEKPFHRWYEEGMRPKPQIGNHTTLVEAFFHSASRMNKFIAAADPLSGEVGYSRLKVGVILLAQAFKNLPGKNVGILLPASVGANMAILAAQLAGKVPVMINWTLGPRNLKVVMDEGQITHAISSWRFLDRLENCDLNGFDNAIVLLEDIRRRFSFMEKLKAKWLSKRSPDSILRHFGVSSLKKHDNAVILFTSGTESLPKAVPLTHGNILSNLKGALELVDFKCEDVLLGALPPFHSFGFSVTGLFPLISGLKVAYLPNPTDGRRMARGIEKWGITLLCLAPTFLKNIVRGSSEGQLSSLRLIVSGAEKMPLELRESLHKVCRASIVEGYGITECAPILTINPPQEKQKGVGRPLPGIELCIVHPETHLPLPLHQEGLILAKGPNVFKGYFDTKIATPFIEVGTQKWYNTGDLGFLDDEGFLTLSGRMKRFAKIGGEMISLAAIEEVLLAAASNQKWKVDSERSSLAVVAKESESGKKTELCLFTIFPLTLEEANGELRKAGMSNLIRLASVKQLPFIPLLGTGKIDYRHLTSLV